jgi:hypothetical protein
MLSSHPTKNWDYGGKFLRMMIALVIYAGLY